MKNREMLMELKKVEPMFDKLIDVAHEIVESTFDNQCCSIDDLIVGDKTVEVQYEYRCCGEYGHDYAYVPIEWFDEGFDYEAAYKEMQRIEQKKLEAKKKRKAAAKKAAATRKAKKEHELYLKLKQKYEAKHGEDRNNRFR